MFDVGWQELALIGAVALVAIGPKELPGALRALGQFTHKARGIAREFRAAFDEAVNEADLDDFKRQARKAAGVDEDDELDEDRQLIADLSKKPDEKPADKSVP